MHERLSAAVRNSSKERDRSSKKIDMFVSDEEFKANYNPVILQKQSTLVLKTSFHLINIILMALCQTFKNIQEVIDYED